MTLDPGTRASRLALAALLCACVGTEPPIDASADAHEPTPPTDLVDILVVVDSGHYATHLAWEREMGRAVSRLVTDLRDRDLDGDGVLDAPSARSIHVTVVSGDMGVEDVDVRSLCSAGLGDDGRFARAPGGPMAESPGGPANGVYALQEGEDVSPFAAMMEDAPQLVEHCEWQQLLEATLRALSPAPDANGASPVSWTGPGYAPPTFRDGTFGRGGPGGSNEGFLRPGSVLVVLVVAQVDDCSTPDSAIFASSREISSPVRCHAGPEARYPVERYVDGILGLRPSPSRVVFGVMAGIPNDAEEQTPAQILERREMTIQFDPRDSVALLTPACVSQTGTADPARRLVGVAEGIAAGGGHIVTTEICRADTLALGFERRVLAATIDAMQGTP